MLRCTLFVLQYESNSGTRNININWNGGWTYGGPVSNNQWQYITVVYDGTKLVIQTD